MILTLTIIFFILGLIIGSFLNVVIYRLNTKRSLGGRSACMVCKHKLMWYELIPLLSFLGLRGRCRKCRTKISIQYPLVELATGLIFAALFCKFQSLFFKNTFVFSLIYFYYVIAFSLLIVIAVYDIRHKIIPDTLSFIFGILALAGLFFFSSNGSFHFPSILELLSGPLVALPFYLFWLISSGAWMGLGDAKLSVGLGWLLGLSAAISGIVLAFWVGAIVGIALIIFSSKKHGMKSEIPFAPYLVLGALIAFFLELNIFNIYL